MSVMDRTWMVQGKKKKKVGNFPLNICSSCICSLQQPKDMSQIRRCYCGKRKQKSWGRQTLQANFFFLHQTLGQLIIAVLCKGARKRNKLWLLFFCFFFVLFFFCFFPAQTYVLLSNHKQSSQPYALQLSCNRYYCRVQRHSAYTSIGNPQTCTSFSCAQPLVNCRCQWSMAARTVHRGQSGYVPNANACCPAFEMFPSR